MRAIRKSIVAQSLVVIVLTATPPAPAFAVDDLPGIELLTGQEQVEYRQSMRGMLSAGQRDQIRRRYEALIQQRAKERGVTLPGQPQTAPGQGHGAKGPGSGGSAQ
jgi:hypothetical protein